jgi:glycosyltransferase involved in cell wall biosynthesis
VPRTTAAPPISDPARDRDVDARPPAHVLHVITDLDVGGAERSLAALVGPLAEAGFAATVVSLMRGGALAEVLRRDGVPVHELGLKPGRPSPRALLRLVRIIRAARPDLVQTWMYHADLLGGAAARLAGRMPVVWGLHNTNLDPRHTKRSTRWVVRACAALSRRVPNKIVSCSDAGVRIHVEQGYAAERFVSIPNGFDTTALQPDPAQRTAVRAELGLAENAVVIGQVARFDPQKDHHNFVRAAARVAGQRPDAHFVLVGKGCAPDNATLAGWIDATGCAERFHLLGLRADAGRLLGAFDVAVLSSAYGEAFPLVVGEAMACGVPCVATDVGDAARIIGDTGRIVAPRDAPALAAAVLELLAPSATERAAFGAAARSRIVAEFSLPAVAARYAALYDELIDHHEHR